MRKITYLALICTATAALAACGGGGSSGYGSNQSGLVVATDAEVVGYVKSSNIDFLPFRRAPGTWRWPSTPTQHILVYIPTPTPGNATEQDYSAKTQNSVAIINAKLTGLLFLEVVNSIPSNGNYIRVGYGNSYVPPGSTDYSSYCANVASGPSVGNPIQPSSTNSIQTSPVYLNLGNGHCEVTQAIVTHEFGHALGLSEHFNGFGIGDATSKAFWDVLATLYANPQATITTNLVVKHAAL